MVDKLTRVVQILPLLGGTVSLVVKTPTAGDFPGGPVVKNPPSRAEDEGLIPGQETRIPPVTGQLNLHPSTREKPKNHNKTQHSQKITKKNLFKKDSFLPGFKFQCYSAGQLV